ncbi:hypothetical protein HYH02_004749 [Chlamydomonas schloesseri]|uniref:Telomeric single stranded DNA binding POT1/Cdc13 domain-containing protein n=1 Tax=Chlamydomonas schloesseri TaxID=2026947 RepID=A0A835WP44_9CHLO|nr:hypothetical protein HYH02_004749 [Chlamydomonas schloesseri]|eukprot:KAG2450917.1 hypothetical protein HYH02_004749 [Chlamydomonas schloesseri]
MATRSTRSAGPPVATLAELLGPGIPFGNVFSVYAVVTSCSTVMGSTAGGKDVFVFLQLRDPTLPWKLPHAVDKPPAFVETVTCQVFAPATHLLPRLEGRRDQPEVLYLHTVKKHNFNGTTQLQARIRPAKTPQDGDMYALYPSNVAPGQDPAKPLMLSHGRDTAFKVDMQRVNALRDWLSKGMAPALPAPVPAQPGVHLQQAQAVPAAGGSGRGGGSPKLLRLVTIAPPGLIDTYRCEPGTLQPVDVICRVLAVDFSRYPEWYVLHVWDGTDFVPVPISYNSEPVRASAAGGAAGAPVADSANTAGPGGAGGAAAAAEGSRRSQRKRGRDGNHDDAAAPQQHSKAAGGAAEEDRGQEEEVEDADPLFSRCAPPDRCRLLMPLASIAQLGDSGTAGAGGSVGDGGGGWEVLSSALQPHEMPVAGGAVPVVLPAALFTLEPPSFAAGKAGGKGGAAAKGGGAGAAEAGGKAGAPAPGDKYALPRPGDYIKLKNVLPRFVQGQLQLLYTASSHYVLRTAKDMHKGLSDYELRIQERRVHYFVPDKPEYFLARAYPESWRSLPLKTLRQVQLQQSTCDVSPARVYARVAAVLWPGLPPAAAVGAPLGPAEQEGLRRAVMAGGLFQLQADVPPGSALDTGGNGSSYGVALLLQDSTAMLRAVAVGSAANLLFWHIPPPAPSADGAGPSAVPAMGGFATQQPQQQQGLGQPPIQQDVACVSEASAGEVSARTRARAAKDQAPQSQPSQVQGGDRPRKGRGRKSLADGGWTPVPKSQLQQEPHGQQRQGPEKQPAQQQQQQQHKAGAAWWGPLQDDEERLRRFAEELRCLTDQTVRSGPVEGELLIGSWIECVLRPMYRSRSNPWQSAVYAIEHTAMVGTPAAKEALEAGAAPPPPAADT